MALTELGSKGVYWIHVSQVRVQWQATVNMVMNYQVP